MKFRRIVRALGCASVLSLASAATPAAAQQIDRIIAFGDSYADIGNALRLGGVNPLTTQIYTTGRFSGGTNYIDTLTSTLQVPQYNFAIGGARTNNGNQTAGLPGFTFEVQQFLAGGGALGFPSVSTALDRSDLVAVSIGGNDARAYQQGGGTAAGAAAAADVAVTNFQQNFDQVMQKGTPTISFLAGDTGLLPEIASNPAGASVRTAYSTEFNLGVQHVLAGYAAKGSIVHYLDLTTMLNRVNANPAAYGLAAVNCPALPNTTCVADSNAPYLFYVDALHPTSRGFAIIAKYVAAQLAAPLTLQAPSDLGFETARQWGRTLNSRNDLYGRSAAADGLRLYVLGDAFSRHVGATTQNSAYDLNGYGGSVGVEYGVGGATVGIAGNYSRPKLTFGNDAARLRARSWQVGAYGSMSAGGLFGQGYVGYGRDRNRLTRVGVIDDLSARPNGSHWVAGAKGGYLMPLGGFSAGPIVALDYARAKVNSYSESGDAALKLNVSSQTQKALIGQAGVELRGELAGLHPYIDVVAEHDFTGNDRMIDFSQATSTVIVNHWAVTGDKETYARLSGGASASLTSGISIDAAVSTTLGRNNGQDVGGQLGVKAKF